MGSGWRTLSHVYVAVKGLFRYKGAVFWVIVFPILFYGLMVAIWGTPSYQPVSLGIVNHDPENGDYNMSTILIRAMNESKLFRLKLYNNESSLLYDLRHGRISVGIAIPVDFTDNLTSLNPARLHLYYTKSPWSSYDVGVASGFINSFANSYREKVINITLQYAIEHVPSNLTMYMVAWFNYIRNPIMLTNTSYAPEMLATKEGIRAFYAIGMIGVEVLFIGLSAGVTAIIDMKRNGTLSLLLSSPMKAWEAFTGLTLEVLYSVAIASIAIWIVSLLLGAKYHLEPVQALSIIILLIIGTLFTIGLGLLLAPLAKSQEAAMAIVNGLAFPIMFIGGLVIPDFVLPSYMRSFAKYYPLSMTIKSIRDMTIYNATPMQAISESIPAIIATIIVFIIGFKIFNILLASASEE